MLRRLLGVKSEDKKQTKVAKLTKGELLLINIGSTSTGGRVLSVKADLAKIQLTTPACTEIGEKVALSRRIEKHWRLVGECMRFPVKARVLNRLLRRLGFRSAGNGVGARLDHISIVLTLTTRTHIAMLSSDIPVAIEAACINAQKSLFLTRGINSGGMVQK